MLQCSFGAAPTSLVVLPSNCVTTGGVPAATIMDYAPVVNVPTFGMCSAPSNPTVASATAAALGVLTPMPCVPVTAAPWTPGAATVLIGSMPVLDSTSKLMCSYGGVIQITTPGQFTVEVP
jgi:PAB1-binding protein PBP1